MIERDRWKKKRLIGDAWIDEESVHAVGVNPLEAHRDHLRRKGSAAKFDFVADLRG